MNKRMIAVALVASAVSVAVAHAGPPDPPPPPRDRPAARPVMQLGGSAEQSSAGQPSAGQPVAVNVTVDTLGQTLWGDPLPIVSIYPVEFKSPVPILAAGKVEPTTRMWLIVAAPLQMNSRVGDPPSPLPRPPPPPVVPVLHVNQYTGYLARVDVPRRAAAWLVPQIPLERADFWYCRLSRPAAEFWLTRFWANKPALESIRATVQRAEPAPRGAAAGGPTYSALQISSLTRSDQKLASMEDVASVLMRDVPAPAAGQGAAKSNAAP